MKKPTSGINKRRRYRDLAIELAHHFASTGHIVHFSQSKSTPSCYIKLDYGAGYTIRISDHMEKEGLDYRFNLMMDMTQEQLDVYKQSLHEPKHPRLFFTFHQVELLKHAVHLSKKARLQELGAEGYRDYVSFCKGKFTQQKNSYRHTFAAKAQRIYST